jgi:hypothetical protein
VYLLSLFLLLLTESNQAAQSNEFWRGVLWGGAIALVLYILIFRSNSSSNVVLTKPTDLFFIVGNWEGQAQEGSEICRLLCEKPTSNSLTMVFSKFEGNSKKSEEIWKVGLKGHSLILWIDRTLVNKKLLLDNEREAHQSFTVSVNASKSNIECRSKEGSKMLSLYRKSPTELSLTIRTHVTKSKKVKTMTYNFELQ